MRGAPVLYDIPADGSRARAGIIDAGLIEQLPLKIRPQELNVNAKAEYRSKAKHTTGMSLWLTFLIF
jgi:hypothetical protein